MDVSGHLERTAKLEAIQDAHAVEIREFKACHRREMRAFRETLEEQGKTVQSIISRLDTHLGKVEGEASGIKRAAYAFVFLATAQQLGVLDAIRTWLPSL